MEYRIEIADKLAVIADELQGVAEILSVMRENKELQGTSAKSVLLLQHDVTRIEGEIRSIAGKI